MRERPSPARLPLPARARPSTASSTYLFQYTRQGEISVWRTQNGANTALRSWTSHPAVNTGDAWNTLRVVAEGGDLDYYVNGTLVWSGTDFTFSTGRVGIGLYVTSDGVGDSLDVDSAVLYGEVHPSPESTPTPAPLSRVDSGDYDGDGTSDAAIFRGPSGLWSVRGLTRFYLGNSADAPVCADYDGDGTSDAAIFRGSSGLWSVRNLTRIYFGSSGDAPVPFEAGGRKRAAVFRSSSGLWSIRDLTRFYFGGSADIPVAGNFNEAPSWEGAIFRPASGLWSVRDLTRFYFGGGGDVPVPAEYAGTGTDRAGIFRPSSGLWSVRDLTRFYFGSAGDLPVTR